jgi:hypothetical protein
MSEHLLTNIHTHYGLFTYILSLFHFKCRKLLTSKVVIMFKFEMYYLK